MKKIFHPSHSRGHANHGWLNARHSFSFASYYNPEKMNFGALRVMNHDIVAPGMGFGTHPHDNMEIITIPLHGDLEHKDSMDNASVIHAGEIQVMSAGLGILHSEFNPNANAPTELLQIWVFPNKQDVEPRYQQMKFDFEKPGMQTLLQSYPEENKVWIHQNARFSWLNATEGSVTDYQILGENNGVYAFVLQGSCNIEDQALELNDAIGVYETDKISIHATHDCRLLLLDVPMF